MPKHIKLAFLESFAKFPAYNFIMKYNIDPVEAKFFDMYPNVFRVNWLDQRSILGRLFGFSTSPLFSE